MRSLLSNTLHVLMLTKNLQKDIENRLFNETIEKLPDMLSRAVFSSSEKGASSWLSVLPTKEHGCALHKGAFVDELCLRYGWQTSNMVTKCVCGKAFNVDHSLNWPCGVFPSICHIKADLLSEVCYCVGIEPTLQPLTNQMFHYNIEDRSRLDVVTQNFWGPDRQNAYFDVRVINHFAPAYLGLSLNQCYRWKKL